MPDLKPCPFCGGKDVDVDFSQSANGCCVFCAKCGPMCFDKYETDVVEAWNNRAKLEVAAHSTIDNTESTNCEMFRDGDHSKLAKMYQDANFCTHCGVALRTFR